MTNLILAFVLLSTPAPKLECSHINFRFWSTCSKKGRCELRLGFTWFSDNKTKKTYIQTERCTVWGPNGRRWTRVDRFKLTPGNMLGGGAFKWKGYHKSKTKRYQWRYRCKCYIGKKLFVDVKRKIRSHYRPRGRYVK